MGYYRYLKSFDGLLDIPTIFQGHIDHILDFKHPGWLYHILNFKKGE